ncbi:MAG: TRAP transporter substrate-binding protein [Cypionkella sp.]|nr:TRAP transporter substrate-binding protein [Cypionkella sp.]
MPTPYSDTTFHTKNIVQFADELRAATGGAIDITVHSAGSLLPHGEIKAAVRSGQVPLGEFFLSNIANEDLAYGLDSQPFIATSYDEARKLWELQKPVITELLAGQNLVPLYSVAWPAQGLYTNGEIKTVADLNGLRMRAYNPALEEFANLAGAAPIQVEAADIPQAFATGQIGAMITSPSTGVSSAAWDFVTHYSPINAWVPKNIVVMNKDAFDALDEPTRRPCLPQLPRQKPAAGRCRRPRRPARPANSRPRRIIVYDPSAELTAGLQEIGGKMLESWNARASEQAKAILAAFQK